MAFIFPEHFPVAEEGKWSAGGSVLVRTLLEKALGNDWWVFYRHLIPGSRWCVDFIVVSPDFGVFACDIKYALANDWNGAFHQMHLKDGLKRHHDPFTALVSRVGKLFHAMDVNISLASLHPAIWFPMLEIDELQYPSLPNTLTKKHLDPAAFTSYLHKNLPGPLPIDQSTQIYKQIGSLSHGSVSAP